MKKRLIFILSFLLALLVSVGVAAWIIVYQTKSPYPTELSGTFELKISYDSTLLTPTNGQLKGDLIKAGIPGQTTTTQTTVVVNHVTPDGKTYRYPVHRMYTNVYKLENTELMYGVAAKQADGTVSFTANNSKLTAETNGTTAVAVKILFNENDDANSDTQRFLRALLALPAPNTTEAEGAAATFLYDEGLLFNVTNDNRVTAVYQNNADVAMPTVAYNGSGNNKSCYGTIEGAINAHSNDTTYVEPGNTEIDPYILKNCTVKNTLTLPYEGTSVTTMQENVKTNAYLAPTTYLKTRVTLYSELTITGTLNIGGIVNAGGGGSLAGQTCGNYAQITLNGGKIKVNNGSKVNCYGFIKGSSTYSDIEFLSGSTLLMPFVLHEFRGGSVSSAMQKKDGTDTFTTCPFLRFTFVNIDGAYRIHYGATANAMASLHASGTTAQQSASVVSSSSDAKPLVQLSTNSRLDVLYDSNNRVAETAFTTSPDTFGKLVLNLHGNASINSLDIEKRIFLMTIRVSSKGAFLPVSYLYDVHFYEGTFDLTGQNIKILPGGSVTIHEGATVNAAQIMCYDQSPQQGAAGYFSYPAASAIGEGSLIVNGTLTATDLGGKVLSTEASAKITTKISTVSDYDLINTYHSNTTTPSSSVVYDKYDYYEAGILGGDDTVVYYLSTTETLALNDYNNASNTLSAAGSYYSEKRSDGTFGWYATPYTVTVHNQYNSTNHTFTDTKETEISDKNGFTIPTQTSDLYYTFGGWFYDNGYTLPVDTETSNKIYQKTDLYAKWTLNNYTINYVHIGIEKYDPSKLVIDGLDALPTTISYENGFGVNLPALSYISESPVYTFKGWRLSSATGSQISAYNNTLLNAADETRTVTLYATWTQATTYKITYDYGAYAEYIDDYDWNTSDTVIIGDPLLTPNTSTFDNISTIQHCFDGWAMSANGERIDTLTEELVGDNTEITLYARWIDKVKVNSVVDETTTLIGWYMPNGEVTTPAAPTKTGYLFLHWNVDNVSEFGESTTFTLQNATYGDTVNMTAEYEQLITISFNLDGGTAGFDVNDEKYKYVRAGAEYTAPAAPEKEGFKFIGWTVTGEAALVDSLAAGDSAILSSTPGAQVTLTAEYKQLVKITIDPGVGSLIEVGTTDYVEAGVPYPAPAVDVPEHKYGTWYFDTWIVTEEEGKSWKLAANDSAVLSYTPGAQVTLTARYKVSITVETNSATISSTDFDVNGDIVEIGKTITFTANTTEDKLTVTINGKGTTEREVTISEPITIEVTGSSCITADTLITLADGTQKRVDQLRGDELLLVWNLNTGRYDVAPIVFVDSESETEYEIIHLYFSDGSDVKVIYEHGFFDLNLRKYVYIDAYNYAQFIGHEFVTQGDISSNTWKKATLTNVVIETERTTAYSPVTFEHLCYYTNGVLSMPGGISGLFNIFDVNTETMSYDEEQMQKDIETYGLFSYDDFKDLIPEVAFDAFNGKWLKVAIGKGMLTWEDIEYLAARYVPLM